MIRSATEADLPEITRVRTSVRENHLSVEEMAARGITHQSVAAKMSAGDLGAWVAEDGGRVVAFAMADRHSGNLFALFTEPGFEGRGFGTRLLAKCEQWLHEAGIHRMILDTDATSAAVGFYQKRGFTITTQQHGDVLMAKDLNRP